MHSTHNEGKSVVAEGFIKTLKNTVYKHITAVSVVESGLEYKNIYFLYSLKTEILAHFNK